MPRNLDTSTPSLEDLIQSAATLSRAELLELQTALAGLLEATESSSLDGQPKGSIEWKTIRDKKRDKEYGPYAYLRYWEDGKLKSKYLKDYLEDSQKETMSNEQQSGQGLV